MRIDEIGRLFEKINDQILTNMGSVTEDIDDAGSLALERNHRLISIRDHLCVIDRDLQELLNGGVVREDPEANTPLKDRDAMFDLLMAGIGIDILAIFAALAGLTGVLLGGPRILMLPGLALMCIGLVVTVIGSIQYSRAQARWRQALVDEMRARIQIGGN